MDEVRVFQAIGGRRPLRSMFVIRNGELEYLTPGSRFRRVRDEPDIVETAEVTGVFADASGIPHVRYDVTLEKAHRAPQRDGPRMLALRTFLENFDERVWRDNEEPASTASAALVTANPLSTS